jgi:hypothetical protein
VAQGTHLCAVLRLSEPLGSALWALDVGACTDRAHHHHVRVHTLQRCGSHAAATPLQAGGRSGGACEPAEAPRPGTPLSVPRLRPAAAAAPRGAGSPGDAGRGRCHAGGATVAGTTARVAALLLDGRADRGGRVAGRLAEPGPGYGDENADANRRADVDLPSPDRPPAAKAVWNVAPPGPGALASAGGGPRAAALVPGAAGASPGPGPGRAPGRRGAAAGGSRLGRKRKVEPEAAVAGASAPVQGA